MIDVERDRLLSDKLNAAFDRCELPPGITTVHRQTVSEALYPDSDQWRPAVGKEIAFRFVGSLAGKNFWLTRYFTRELVEGIDPEMLTDIFRGWFSDAVESLLYPETISNPPVN